MAKALPDEVLDAVLVSGRYDELPEALASRFGGLVDRITMMVPDDPVQDSMASAAIGAIRACWPGD